MVWAVFWSLLGVLWSFFWCSKFNFFKALVQDELQEAFFFSKHLKKIRQSSFWMDFVLLLEGFGKVLGKFWGRFWEDLGKFGAF